MPSGRPPSADITAKVDAARKLIQADPDLSYAKVARQVGTTGETLRRRLNDLDRDGAPGGGQITPADPLDTELDPGEIPVVKLDYRDSDVLYVYPLGDIHKGSPQHAGEKWRSWLEYLAEHDNTSMLGTGDFLNAALTTSVSDTYEETSPVGVAKRELRAELKPLADAGRLDILIPGNHEARVHRAIGDCPIEDVADALCVPYSRSAALLVYQVGDQEYEIFVRHGSGSGRSGAQAGRMERESQIIIADVYVAGHTHRQNVINGVIFERQGDEVVRRRQKYVTSGSFLSYEAYAATAGLPPADIGAPRIRLDGARKRVFVSV